MITGDRLRLYLGMDENATGPWSRHHQYGGQRDTIRVAAWPKHIETMLMLHQHLKGFVEHTGVWG